MKEIEVQVQALKTIGALWPTVPGVIPALVAIMERLRAPDGCPWDREQTTETMAPSLVEEAFEAADVVLGILAPPQADVERLKAGAIVVGLMAPHQNLGLVRAMAGGSTR